MEISKDFEEFFELLNENKVKYLVVGGYAFAVHAEPRYTKDLDLYLEATEESAEKILHVLNKFGFSSLNFEKNDFYTPNRVVQLGYPPHRIDLLTSIEGVKFKNAWENRITAEYGGQQIYVIGKEDLIKNKRAVGRPRDILDAESLEKSKNN